MRKPQPPPTPGRGDLTVRRETYTVAYAYSDDRRTGSVTHTPEVLAEAFSWGDAKLRLETGDVLDLRIVGYTAGSETAYFEVVKRDNSTTHASPFASAHASPRRAPATT